jgi:hypothetical protein
MARKYRRRKGLGQRRADGAVDILDPRKILALFRKKLFALILRAVYKVGISFRQ